MVFHIDKVLYKLEVGATEPYLAMIKNQAVIIKTFNNRFSNKVLINEFICLKLANIIGLTIPEGGIGIIDELTDLEDIKEDLAFEGTTINGKCFFSSEIYGTVFDGDESPIMNLVNNDEINTVILFDYLIYNDDRHEGNLLIDLKTSLMYIIDHSHVFKDKHTWTSTSIKENIKNNDFKDTNIYIENYDAVYRPFLMEKIITEDALKKASDKIKNAINDKILDDIFNEVPYEWKKNMMTI